MLILPAILCLAGSQEYRQRRSPPPAPQTRKQRRIPHRHSDLQARRESRYVGYHLAARSERTPSIAPQPRDASISSTSSSHGSTTASPPAKPKERFWTTKNILGAVGAGALLAGGAYAAHAAASGSKSDGKDVGPVAEMQVPASAVSLEAYTPGPDAAWIAAIAVPAGQERVDSVRACIRMMGIGEVIVRYRGRMLHR